MPKKLLTRPQATAFLREEWGLELADSSMDQMGQTKSTRRGPKFSKIGGRVYYLVEDLNAWVTERLSSPGEAAALRCAVNRHDWFDAVLASDAGHPAVRVAAFLYRNANVALECWHKQQSIAAGTGMSARRTS